MLQHFAAVHAALLISRLVLAAALGVAGIAKLFDLPGSRQALVDFGLPRWLAVGLGPILPLAEVGTAIALLPVASAWWGALAALSLLALFIVGIAANLARGREPECHCFGQLHSEPIGRSTLARNAGLVAVAVFVVAQGRGSAGPSAVHWVALLNGNARVELGLALGMLVVFAIQLGLWFGLLRQHGRVLLRMDALEAAIGGSSHLAADEHHGRGLPIGAVAPTFELPNLDGVAVSLDALRFAGKDIVLAFVEPSCGPCVALMPQLAVWQSTHTADLALVVISSGSVQGNREHAAEHGLAGLLLQSDHEVMTAYQIRATPSAQLVRADGTIGSTLAMGPEAVTNLVEQVAGGNVQAVAPHREQYEPVELQVVQVRPPESIGPT
jgi:peroxiredoxin